MARRHSACAARLYAPPHLAHVENDVEVHEMIWNCELVYSIDRE